jgi:hypothetical protein
MHPRTEAHCPAFPAGILVVAVVLAAVAGATFLQAKAPGPETLATVSTHLQMKLTLVLF